MRKYTVILVVSVLVLVMIAGACAGRAPSPTPKPAPAPAPVSKPTPAPAPKPAPTAAPKPAPTAAPKPAPAATSAADFYKNNPLTVVCATAAGGGVDYGARLFATFWSDVTGGTARVKNVTGGAGQAGINQSFTDKPDGLTVTSAPLGASVTLSSLLKDPAVKYDMFKFSWIGSVVGEKSTFVISSKLPYRTLDEVRKSEGLKFGAMAPTASNAIAAAIVIDTLGLKGATIVTGYPGSSQVALAVGKGELGAMVFSPPGTTTYINQGYVKAPFVLVSKEKSPWFPNVPTIPEVVKLTPEQDKLLTVMSTTQGGFGVFFAMPGVPQDRVEFVRDAFIKITKLPAYKTLYKVMWPIWEEPTAGKDLASQIGSLAQFKKEDTDKLLQLVQKYKAL